MTDIDASLGAMVFGVLSTLVLLVIVLGGLVRLGRSSVVNAASHQTPVLWTEFSLEIERSRRYQRACSIMCFSTSNIAEDEFGTLLGLETRLWAWGRLLRNIDRVWHDNGSLFVMLPETDRAGAEAFLARIRQQHPEIVPQSDIAIASFPEDGLTYGAVLNTLKSSARPSNYSRSENDLDSPR